MDAFYGLTKDIKDIKEIKSPEAYSSSIKLIIGEFYDDIFKHFKVQSELEFMIVMKILDFPTGSICAQQLKLVGGWKCNDCCKSESSIFCNECWKTMKDKHIGHDISYTFACNGICDCGDPNAISPDLFCKKHKGPMLNDNEINTYVAKCFNINIIQVLKLSIQKSIDLIAPFLMKAIEEKKINEPVYMETITFFLNFLTKLCESNTSVVHIISECLFKTYKFKTNHSCLEYNKDTGKFNIIGTSFFKHECKCPFIRLLLNCWTDKHSSLLYNFIKNYKVRSYIGTAYIFIYDVFYKNCIKELGELSVQILSEEACSVIVRIPNLIEKMFICVPEILNLILDYKKIKVNKDGIYLVTYFNKSSIKASDVYKEYHYIAQRVFFDLIYFIKPSSATLVGDKEKIYTSIIDALAALHNYNSFFAVDSYLNHYTTVFYLELLEIENLLLEIFALLVKVFDFNNKALTKKIFSYFNTKLTKIKTLEKDKFSFHISLYRCFAIFLNRYCYYFAHTSPDNKNKDLIPGLKSALSMLSSYKSITKSMTINLFKYFGVILAIGENFLNSYEGIKSYYTIYFAEPRFHNRDFMLLKYLMVLPENKELFNFSTILSNAEVSGSFAPINSNVFKSVNPNPAWLSSNLEHAKLNQRIITFILSILRSNTCLIWDLCTGYKEINFNKVEDTLLQNIILGDKENMMEIIKEIIIQEILINQNLSEYRQITDKIYAPFIKFFGKDLIEKMIIDMTNKTITQDKSAKFSLKDEYLKYVDVNYIIYHKDRSSVEKYLSDFKKDKVSINNTYFFPVPKYEAKLSNAGYETIFFNEINIDFLFNFLKMMLTKDGFEKVQSIFLIPLLHYMCALFSLRNSHFSFFKATIEKKISEMEGILLNNNLKDEADINFCKYIQMKIAESNKGTSSDSFDFEIGQKQKNEIKMEEPISKIEEETQPEIPVASEVVQMHNSRISQVPKLQKTEKQLRLERLKNKFKNKNQKIGEKFGIKDIKLEEKPAVKDACIYCLKEINSEEIFTPFGKMAFIAFDHFMANAFFQNIRKMYNDYYKENLSLKEFDSVYMQPKDRRNLRILPCNHLCHYSCFFQYFMKGNQKNSALNGKCPLCKKKANVFIPCLIHLRDKPEIKDLVKPYELEKVYKTGEKWEKFYIEKDKRNKKKILELSKLADLLPMEEETEYDGNYEEDEKLNSVQEEDFSELLKKEPTFINAALEYCEAFIKIAFKANDIELKNKEDTDMILGAIFIYIFIEFRSFLDFFENVEKKAEQIEAWKNFFLAFRIMMRVGYIDEKYVFYMFYNCLKYFKTQIWEKKLDFLIQYDSFKVLQARLLFFVSLLFDKEQAKEFEMYILQMFVPYFSIGLFIRNIYLNGNRIFDYNKEKFKAAFTSELLYKYIKEQPADVERSFNFVLKKLRITDLLLETDLNCDNISLENNDILNYFNLPNLKNKALLDFLENLEETCLNENSNQITKLVFYSTKPYKEVYDFSIKEISDVIETEKLESVLNPLLFGSCNSGIYHFIDLPETAVAVQEKYYNVECHYCGAVGKISLICMDCGRKICDSIACKAENENKDKVIGFFYHTRICGGGSSCYLSTRNLSILYISGITVYNKFISVYLNKFGEGISNKILRIGNEYKLNKEELEKARRIFNTYDFTNAPVPS